VFFFSFLSFLADSNETTLFKLSPEQQQIYRNIANYRVHQSTAQLAITYCCGASSEALEQTLNHCRQQFSADGQFRSMFSTLQLQVRLVVNGITKLFSYFLEKNSEQCKGTYICIAVRKYEKHNERLFNYHLSTYSFTGKGQLSA